MTTDLAQPASSGLFHIAFYQFAALDDPDAIAAHLRILTKDLLGSILVAPEGINGVLAGNASALDIFQGALVSDPVFGGKFVGIVFKRSACKTAPFGRIKIHRKSEIVALGVSDATVRDDGSRKTHVSPEAWRSLIAQEDVVVLDNRNGFEYRLGRFKGAVNPRVTHFRDFPEYVKTHAPQWKASGKKVAMYCTGGIRCEKTGDWMHELGLEVFQLDGGILNFFQAMPDAERDWEGECFVFDNRIALDTNLEETDTTPEDVYRDEPDGEWRLQRARRLQEND